MPQTRDCDYCGDDIPPGTGTMFVRTDGTAIHYCSSKCEKNADLGREPRDLEWIQDEEAEQLRRAEEGADVADHDQVDDEDPTSAEEEPAGEGTDEETPAGEEAADVAEEEEEAAGEPDEEEIEDETGEQDEATADESGEDEVDEE